MQTGAGSSKDGRGAGSEIADEGRSQALRVASSSHTAQP
jgi:hypothetical protein